GGFFNANDQPISEQPEMNVVSGQNTNYAFARVHRNPCGGPLTVNVDFLYADFGAGANFHYVSAARPSTQVNFNIGDTEAITPGVQWTIPAGLSDHICLVVEIYTANDNLQNGSLDNTSSSLAGKSIPEDNNKAQRNLLVSKVGPYPKPTPYY